MEKICTRCNFRNPGGRGVCQVCGYSKFVPMADAQLVVAKEAASVVNETAAVKSGESLNEILRETKVAVVSAAKKIAALVTNRPVHRTAEVTVDEVRKPLLFDSARSASVNVDAAGVAFESNDLESMIEWFKTYGVDRPLILDAAPAPVVVPATSKAA